MKKLTLSLFLILSLFAVPLVQARSIDPDEIYAPTIGIMGYGASGSSVVLLQQTLKDLGYFPYYSVTTGFYGNVTVQSVKRFQRAHGIINTGRVGPRTQAALQQYIGVNNNGGQSSYTTCIPSNIDLNDPVANAAVNYGGDGNGITVREKLIALGAHCKNGALHAVNNKPIYFYEMKGCWGNAPYNYEEILSDQTNEIVALNDRYELVLIACNKGGYYYQ